MKFFSASFFTFITAVLFETAISATYSVDVNTIDYLDVDGFALQGYYAAPTNAVGPLPAVVIVPDWDGVNTYEQQRTAMLVNMGYVAFAADIYGVNDHVVENRTRRGELAGLYRGDVDLFVQRIKAAVNLVKGIEGVDPHNVALIGYCFGGTGVFNYALTGQDDVKAMVSFHGGLTGIPDGGPEITPKLLVLSGGDDDDVADIIELENTLTAVNASWEITRYSGIEHAFTVFGDDRYNLWADSRSWFSMSVFLMEAFGSVEYMGNRPDSMNVQSINYTDVDGTALVGYWAVPDGATAAARATGSTPTVIILPDWDGVNTYEKERATLLAAAGYNAFAADIFGANLQEDLDIQTRIVQTGLYRDDPDLFNQRIQSAIDLVKTFPSTDGDNIALIGYCFGGTGVIEYAFSGSTDVKAVVSFHGGHTSLPTPIVEIAPYVLVLSGGIDDAHGNQTEMEAAFNMRNASWEITRYAKVDHGYTSWTSDAYNVMADARSWDSMMALFATAMPIMGNTMLMEKPEFDDELLVDGDVVPLGGSTSGAYSALSVMSLFGTFLFTIML